MNKKYNFSLCVLWRPLEHRQIWNFIVFFFPSWTSPEVRHSTKTNAIPVPLLMCFLWMEQVPHLWSVRKMPQTVNPKPHPVQCNVNAAWLVNCRFKCLPSVCFTNRNSRFVALCKVPSRILCRKEMLGFYATNLKSKKRVQEPPKWWFCMIYIVITWGWLQQKAVSTVQRQSNDRAIHGALAIVAPEEVRELTSKGSYLFLWKIEMRRSKTGTFLMTRLQISYIQYFKLM